MTVLPYRETAYDYAVFPNVRAFRPRNLVGRAYLPGIGRLKMRLRSMNR
jgi:hypothetical protein